MHEIVVSEFNLCFFTAVSITVGLVKHNDVPLPLQCVHG